MDKIINLQTTDGQSGDPYLDYERLDVYVTKSGDTWDLIAYEIYGDEVHMKELIEANIELAETVFFEAGVPLICPDIPLPDSANTPPWKR